MKRSAMKRAPSKLRRSRLKPVGARATREKAAVVVFREALTWRSVCERCGCVFKALEAHHLVRRSRCVGWPDRHNSEVNGAAVCWACHRSLDLDPMDVGGPMEAVARAAHAAFNAWRAGTRT